METLTASYEPAPEPGAGHIGHSEGTSASGEARRRWRAALWLVVVLGGVMSTLVACGDKADDTGPAEGDVDTDVDADTDADSDADTDADSDADADSDTDTDPNAPPTLDSTADAVLVGEESGDGFGTFVAGGGDVDGDGFGDVLVAAPHMESYDSVYLFGGPLYGEVSAEQSDATIDGVHGYSLFDASCSILGDTNQDGFDDLVVGLGMSASDAGLFLGPLTGSLGFDEYDALVSGSGSGWPAGQGLTVTPAGDADSNGTADLLFDDLRAVYLMSTPLEGEVDAENEALAILTPPWPTEMHPCWLDHHWEIEYESRRPNAKG